MGEDYEDDILIVNLNDDDVPYVVGGQAHDVLLSIMQRGVEVILERGEQVAVTGFVMSDRQFALSVIPYEGDKEQRDTDFRVFVHKASNMIQGRVFAVGLSAESLMTVIKDGIPDYVQDTWSVIVASDSGVRTLAMNIDGAVGTPNRKLSDQEEVHNHEGTGVDPKSGLVMLVASASRRFFVAQEKN